MKKFVEETTNLEIAVINPDSLYAESERRILRSEGYKYSYTKLGIEQESEVWKKY